MSLTGNKTDYVNTRCVDGKDNKCSVVNKCEVCKKEIAELAKIDKMFSLRIQQLENEAEGTSKAHILANRKSL